MIFFKNWFLLFSINLLSAIFKAVESALYFVGRGYHICLLEKLYKSHQMLCKIKERSNELKIYQVFKRFSQKERTRYIEGEIEKGRGNNKRIKRKRIVVGVRDSYKLITTKRPNIFQNLEQKTLF